jgi:hypothetical protein
MDSETNSEELKWYHTCRVGLTGDYCGGITASVAPRCRCRTPKACNSIAQGAALGTRSPPQTIQGPRRRPGCALPHAEGVQLDSPGRRPGCASATPNDTRPDGP